jgi:phosphatidylserine/phosphatidylglycerophosphate/cardiolipin synthase-like enzyme
MFQFLLAILIIYAGVLIRQRFKAMPVGTDYEGPSFFVDPGDVSFIYDLRFEEEGGRIVFEDAIFPEIFKSIESAGKSIVADMFLYNSDHGEDRLGRDYRSLTGSLTSLLCAKGEEGLDVLLITDEINNFYGSFESPIHKKLQACNVCTVLTRLDRMRDPNPMYSSLYRLFPGRIFKSSAGVLKHPFGDPEKKISLSALFRSLNFKANHRKVVVVDSSLAVVTSANPHDPSSLHSNIAFMIKGPAARDVEYAELAVAAFSGHKTWRFQDGPPWPSLKSGDEIMFRKGLSYKARVLTEKKIKDHLIREFQYTTRGGLIMLASLYLTDRRIMAEIKEAAARGVEIRIILDPSEHAFGLKKYGIPNKHASLDLNADPHFGRNLNIRWYRTHGEQFHAKMAIFKRKDTFVVIGGSANFTSRNLDNFNLELNLRLDATPDSRLCRDVCSWFHRIWFNEQGSYTMDYELLKDESRLKYLLYRIQEGTGMCTY